MSNYRTTSEEDTFALGRALGRMLTAGDVVLLTGDLGAGKSVLTRGMARGVNIDCPMPSPTFTLMQPYRGRVPFYHFDLYRLDESDEFYESGLDEYIGGDGVAVVEWPDRMDLALTDHLALTLLRGTSDENRLIDIKITGMEDRKEQILDALDNWRAFE